MKDNVVKIIAHIKKIAGGINPFLPDEDGKNSDYESGRMAMAMEILQYVVRLQEEPVSDGLEEEVYEHLWKGRMGTDVSRPIYLSYDEPVAVACHFTNWQKGQMIKEAVKGEVGEYYPTTIYLDKNIPELKHFDKVKLIIIMEE